MTLDYGIFMEFFSFHRISIDSIAIGARIHSGEIYIQDGLNQSLRKV